MAGYSLGKTQRKRKDGTKLEYYVLRKAFYDPVRGSRVRYVGYVGTEPVITRSKALEFCKKEGIDIEELERVNRLKIIADENGAETNGGERD